MTSARYTFSTKTDKDWDIIEYLDAFASTADRTVAIKAAVRAQMDEIESESGAMDLLTNIKDDMSKIATMIQELKKQGVVMPDTISVRTSEGSHEVSLANIDKLLQE